MVIKQIEHIGIAVKSIEESLKYYEGVLGFKCYAVEEVKEQKVKTAFLKVGEVKIELLESTDPDGPVGRFVAKNGGGIHHLAYLVDDVQEALDDVEKKGAILIDKTPRNGAEGLKIGFLHPKSTDRVLTELCENPNNN